MPAAEIRRIRISHGVLRLASAVARIGTVVEFREATDRQSRRASWLFRCPQLRKEVVPSISEILSRLASYFTIWLFQYTIRP